MKECKIVQASASLNSTQNGKTFSGIALIPAREAPKPIKQPKEVTVVLSLCNLKCIYLIILSTEFNSKAFVFFRFCFHMMNFCNFSTWTNHVFILVDS